MKCGYQGCTLAAGSDVAAAKVGDDRNTCQFGEQGRVIELEGIALAGLVTHCLAVAADRCDLLWAAGGVGEQLQDGVGIAACQRVRQQGGTVQFIVAGGL